MHWMLENMINDGEKELVENLIFFFFLVFLRVSTYDGIEPQISYSIIRDLTS